jgi:hypothetical protein
MDLIYLKNHMIFHLKGLLHSRFIKDFIIKMEAFKCSFFVVFLCVFVDSKSLAQEFAYRGRVTDNSGAPLAGPAEVKIWFFDRESGGDPLGPALDFPQAELLDGVFNLTLNLDQQRFQEIFGDGTKNVFVQVEVNGVQFPRQKYVGEAIARKIPVDQSHLVYNSEGKLTVQSIDMSQVSGLSTALGQKADQTALTGYPSLKPVNNLSDVSDTNLARLNLGLGALATKATVTSTELGSGVISDVHLNSSAAISDSKLSPITTAGKVSGNSIISGSIAGTTAFQGSGGVDTVGPIVARAGISLRAQVSQPSELHFNGLGEEQYVGFKGPNAIPSNQVWTLPSADGSDGQFLTTNGSGILSWTTASGAGDMLASANLSDLTDAGAARGHLGLGSLATMSNITSQEIVNGTITNGDISDTASISPSKILGLNDTLAAKEATIASGTSTQYFRGDKTWQSFDLSARTATIANTISDGVTITAPSQDAVFDALATKEPSIASGLGSQYFRGDKTWQALDTSAVIEGSNQYFTMARARNALSQSAPLTYNTSSGVMGISQASSVSDGYLSSTDFTAFNSKQPGINGSSVINGGTYTSILQNGFELKPFSTGTGQTGELRFDELSGNGTNYVGFKGPDAISGNRIWILPSSDGANGEVLSTNGSGILSWVSRGGLGTVTSVGIIAPSAGITVTGAPVTGSGSITLSLSDDLGALEGLSTMGVAERTGSNTWSTFPITSAGKALLDDQSVADQRTTLGLGGISLKNSVDLSADVSGVLPIDRGGTGQITQSASLNALLPAQTGKSGNVLSTNGTAASWISTANWDTAYSERLQWDGGATGLNAATARSSLALGTAAVLNVGTSTGNVLQVASGNKLPVIDGSNLINVTGTDGTKVAKSGDTMNGALNLPSNGLTVGTTQLVVSSGNVGIGIASPNAALDIQGAARTGFISNNSGLTIDWSLGNTQMTSSAAGTLVLNNMLDGGYYTLILTAGSTSAYTLSGSSITTWRCMPLCSDGNKITGNASSHTIVTILKAGTTGYVSWQKGY